MTKLTDEMLQAIYHRAARAARADGISPDDEPALLAWIRSHCCYHPEVEFFLLFGIGAELGDLRAQAEGYDNQAQRACALAAQRRAAR
jgi:hypothetical protein